MQEQVIQQKSCLHCQNSFDITQGDMEFYNKISPTFAGQKFQIPTPTLCPDCRQRRRLSFRNERNLYKRKCDASGKDIISIYKPSQANPSALSGTSLSQGRTHTEQQGFKVYDQKIRRSDARDPMEYGRDFDFSRSFTNNFKMLSLEVPHSSQFNTNAENSEYCNHVGDMKNSYLCSASWNCENVMYSSKTFEIKNSLDLFNSNNIEYSYQLINCENCYSSYYLLDSSNCSFSFYLINCIGCEYCFMSHGLVNQKYVFYNKQYTREEYHNLINNISLYNGWAQFENMKVDISKYRTDMIIQSENCIGHRISRSTNCIECYNIANAQDCKYIANGGEICSDVYDGFGIGYEQQLAYEIVDTGVKSSNNLFNVVTHGCHYSVYSMACYNSFHLFGCIGLRNKSYCIFNKQYTKEEYEKTVANIITHMIETGERGEFFYPSLSPFGYNETVAQEYYPANLVGTQFFASDMRTDKNLSLQDFGYHRSHYQAPSPVADKVIDGKDLPETIDEISDDILKSAIKCEVTGKLFRIIPQELAFYRKHHIPLPRKHPDQRHKERMELRK